VQSDSLAVIPTLLLLPRNNLVLWKQSQNISDLWLFRNDDEYIICFSAN